MKSEEYRQLFRLPPDEVSDQDFGFYPKFLFFPFNTNLYAQKNYSTLNKEILAIVHAVTKFESDLLNKEFLIRVDCKAAKDILFKDVKNLASNQIFARWQGYIWISPSSFSL